MMPHGEGILKQEHGMLEIPMTYLSYLAMAWHLIDFRQPCTANSQRCSNSPLGCDRLTTDYRWLSQHVSSFQSPLGLQYVYKSLKQVGIPEWMVKHDQKMSKTFTCTNIHESLSLRWIALRGGNFNSCQTNNNNNNNQSDISEKLHRTGPMSKPWKCLADSTATRDRPFRQGSDSKDGQK